MKNIKRQFDDNLDNELRILEEFITLLTMKNQDTYQN